MSQSLAKLYVHIAFSSKVRFPYLSQEDIREEMHASLGGSCNKLDCPALTVGGTADHVHILCLLSKNMALAKLLEEIKKTSSKWVKTKSPSLAKFGWQNGYGAFSVSRSQVEHVRNYIRGQEEHHKKRSFQDEFRELLNLHEVEYDERYVWD